MCFVYTEQGLALVIVPTYCCASAYASKARAGGGTKIYPIIYYVA